MANKWKKRVWKFKGFLRYFYSLILFRYTHWNASCLKKKAMQVNVSKLHVGCGNVLLEGWLNIFYETREEYGCIRNKDNAWTLNYNLQNSWPFEDDFIHHIAGSHFIEHLDLNAGIKFVKESFRVLKKGGVIRLSCPDLEIYVKNYIEKDKEFFQHQLIREWCTFDQAKTPGEIFIAKAYDSGGAHKWFYDFESLKHILELAGFVKVKRCGRLEGKTPNIELLEPPERELETVFVEAVKG